MAKQNKPADPDRNPAEPIGMPPGGGRWTWDIPLQQWVDLDAPKTIAEQPAAPQQEQNTVVD